MRFMLIPTLLGPSKPAAPEFDEATFKAYMKFNEDMHNAGVLVTSEGLLPPETGAHVIVRGGERKAVDGPYAESKELVAGFWLIDVKSRAEAVEWAKRAPINPAGDEVIEIRKLTTGDDLPRELIEMSMSVAPKWTSDVFAAEKKH